MPGKRLLGLEKSLGQIFRAKKKKAPDPHRRHREQAKKLAAQHTIEIERLEGGGMNVWPPSSIADDSDPFQGDHFANDWQDALAMVEEYARLVPAKEAP